MTREDVKQLLMMAQAAYPNYKPQDKTVAVNVWYMALKEYTYEQAEVAFVAYMKSDTSGFAPAPGQLIDKIQLISAPAELNEMEAWSLVSKAIRNSAYNSVEEFAKLPPLVQKTVGLPDQLRIWATDEDYNEMVVSSNFMRSYSTVLARNREISKMPESVRALIAKVNENSCSAQIERKREQAVNSMIEKKENDVKALEMKSEGVPMPERYREMMEQLGGK